MSLVQELIKLKPLTAFDLLPSIYHRPLILYTVGFNVGFPGLGYFSVQLTFGDSRRDNFCQFFMTAW